MISLHSLNPVLDRELRQRSRSRRSVVMMTLFLLLMTGIAYLVYKAEQTSVDFNLDPFAALTVKVGRSMFEWILAGELLVLLFLIPGISANAISGERDRQTLIPLQVTLVGPVGIYIGKVLASSAFIMLLVVASVPVLAIPFLIGGISLSNVLLSFFVLMVTGFLMSSIGVSCSAIFRRTQTATLAAYGMALAMVVGTLIALAVTGIVDASRGVDEVRPSLAVLYPNPFVGVAAAAGDIGSPGDGPFTPIKTAFIETQAGPNVMIEGNIALDPNTGERIEFNQGLNDMPLWLRSLLSQALIAAFLAFFAIRRLRAPGRVLS